jgi:hypothetical protein
MRELSMNSEAIRSRERRKNREQVVTTENLQRALDYLKKENNEQ